MGLALYVARAMASAWQRLDESSFVGAMAVTPDDVRIGWDGEIGLLVDPYPGPNEQVHGAAVAVMHGSFQWLAPELVTGASASRESSMFSVGMMLYEALVGRYAFGHESTLEILRALLEVTPPPVTAFRDDVPASVCALVERCSQKRGPRYPSWSALLEAIELASREVERFDATDLRALVAHMFPAELAEANRRG